MFCTGEGLWSTQSGSHCCYLMFISLCSREEFFGLWLFWSCLVTIFMLYLFQKISANLRRKRSHADTIIEISVVINFGILQCVLYWKITQKSVCFQVPANIVWALMRLFHPDRFTWVEKKHYGYKWDPCPWSSFSALLPHSLSWHPRGNLCSGVAEYGEKPMYHFIYWKVTYFNYIYKWALSLLTIAKVPKAAW